MSTQVYAESLNSQIEQLLKEEGLVGIGWATITPGGGVQLGTAVEHHLML